MKDEPTVEKAIAVAHQAVERLRAEGEGKARRPVLDLVIDITVLVASADGVVDEAETALVLATVRRMSPWPLDDSAIREEIDGSVRVIRTDGLIPLSRALGRTLAEIGGAEDGLRLAAAAAFASNGLNSTEHAAILEMAHAADVPSERCESILDEVARAVAPRSGGASGGMKIGARNQIRGTVTGVKRGGVMAQVGLHVDGPVDLSSVMTVDSLEDMALKEGDKVRVVVKAIHVLLIRE